MSLKRRLEGEVEISASAADVKHDIVKSKPHHVSHASSHFVQGVDLHDGVHGEVGCAVVWKYALEGKPNLVAKTVLEEAIDEKKLVRYRVVEGDLLEDYKSFVGICEVTPKDSETSIVKWAFEYEKKHPGVPEPSALLDSWLAATKDIEDHHHGRKK